MGVRVKINKHSRENNSFRHNISPRCEKSKTRSYVLKGVLSKLNSHCGEQGWRSDESAGSIPGPGVTSGLSLLLVLYSAPRGFSPGTPVFPSPQKPTFPYSNSILECTGTSERVLVNSSVFRG